MSTLPVSGSAAHTDLADAQLLLGPGARFVAKGATCTVYTDRYRVARLALNAEARLMAQAALQMALAAVTSQVVTVYEVGQLPNGRAYVLEQLVRSDDENISTEGWRDLGQVLRALHHLPHSGYGLLYDQSGLPTGQEHTPQAGLGSRLTATWPFDGLTLENHALVRLFPDLLRPLAKQEAQLSPLVETPSGICHTDLHANQMLWSRGRLAALLDFGDATIAPPAWDIASVAFFHGWKVAGVVAEAAGLPCERDAALFGLWLALHRAERATVQGKAKWGLQAGAFARGCLERLE